jgi:hypothetical protein
MARPLAWTLSRFTERLRTYGLLATVAAGTMLAAIASANGQPPQGKGKLRPGATPPADFLAKKYVIDLPITVTEKSSWIDKVVIEHFLADYLKPRFHQLRYVRFDGKKVNFYGYEAVHLLDKRTDQQVADDLKAQIQKSLQGLFRVPVALPLVHEETGFVNRLTSAVTMGVPAFARNKPTGFYIEVEVILLLERRRASVPNFTTVQMGDVVQGSVLHGIGMPPTSNVVLAEIAKGLKK